MILGLDTATRSTAVGLLLPDGSMFEARDDPAPGDRPGHAARLLRLVDEVMSEAGAGWPDVARLAVGVGPGGFTGLRIGIATARALAQAHDIPVAAVGSLEALAAGAAGAAQAGGPVLAVIDARRGEAFAAAWAVAAAAAGPSLARCLIRPAALPPERLVEALARLRGDGVPAPGSAARAGCERAPGEAAAPLAVGDGAVRFRAELERAGAAVPPDGSPLHRVSAAQVCRLGAAASLTERDALLPDYRREPDAVPPRPAQ